MPISISVEHCTVTSLRFEKSIIVINYVIGSGTKSIVLPEVVQKPDCASLVESVAITSFQSNTGMNEAQISEIITV